jgi:hypothetical protein
LGLLEFDGLSDFLFQSHQDRQSDTSVSHLFDRALDFRNRTSLDQTLQTIAENSRCGLVPESSFVLCVFGFHKLDQLRA